MTFVTPSDDIIVQEGTFAYKFKASGAISGGMFVEMAGPMEVVKASASSNNVVGVAAYTVAKGNEVAVYGPGNIVRTYTGIAMSFGEDIYPSANAGIDNSLSLGTAAFQCGITLEDKVAAGTIKILLK